MKYRVTCRSARLSRSAASREPLGDVARLDGRHATVRAADRRSESASDVAAAVSPVDATRRARFLAAARPRLDHVYRLAGVLLGNATEAEDAVQDALAVAWQEFDRLREPERFGAWLSYPRSPCRSPRRGSRTSAPRPTQNRTDMNVEVGLISGFCSAGAGRRGGRRPSAASAAGRASADRRPAAA